MIAKQIDRPKNKSNIARLTRYMLDVKIGGENPRDWKLTADYITDNKISDSEKVMAVRVTNCFTDDPVLATELIIHTQKQNIRSQTDKTFHFVLSFPYEERPDIETLNKIEDIFCKDLGFSEHQRISAIHQDTANLHIHIAVNKIHPKTFNNYDPFYSHKILMASCEKVEKDFNLIKTNHKLKDDVNTKNQEQAEGKHYKDYEAKTGKKSLVSYVRENIKNTEFQDWDSLHKAFNDIGLIVIKKGNGLVIGNPDKKIWAKASDCYRELSYAKLKPILGEFQKSNYRNTTLNSDKFVSGEGKAKQELYNIYLHKKRLHTALQYSKLKHFADERKHYKIELDYWYKQNSKNLKFMPRAFRKSQRKIFKATKNKQYTEYLKKQHENRSLIYNDRFPTWRDWLHSQALNNNIDALQILQSMQKIKEQTSYNLLTANKAAAGAEFIIKNLRPKILKNGDVLYKSADGGLVIDKGCKVITKDVSTGAAFVALKLAAERFDEPLVLNGTDEFKIEIAKLAGIHNLNVSFADDKYNKIMQEFTPPKMAADIPEPPATEPKHINSISEWINKRNQFDKNKHHVLLNDDVTANFSFIGRRTIGKDKVVLFVDDDRILVKKVSDRIFTQAFYWKKGDMIKVKNSYLSKVNDKGIEL